MPNYPARILENPIRTIQDTLGGVFDDKYYQGYNFIGRWEMSKLALADRERKLAPYLELKSRVKGQTSWSDVVSDNWVRFTALAFLDRVTTVRQSSLFCSNLAYTSKNNFSASANAIRNQGFFRGALRGNLLNYLHFLGVQAQAYVISNGNLTSYLTTLLALETILYPLDTVKTRYQADVSGRYKSFLDSLNRTKPAELYSGLPSKLIFAAIYGFYLSQAGSASGFEHLYNLPLLALAYPFLTLKTIGQVTLTSGNIASNIFGSFTVAEKMLKADGIKVLYRGFVPFAALSLIAPHYFPKIWSSDNQDSALEALNPHVGDRMSSYIHNN